MGSSAGKLNKVAAVDVEERLTGLSPGLYGGHICCLTEERGMQTWCVRGKIIAGG